VGGRRHPIACPRSRRGVRIGAIVAFLALVAVWELYGVFAVGRVLSVSRPHLDLEDPQGQSATLYKLFAVRDDGQEVVCNCVPAVVPL
jgi:hypothetical protein